MTSPVCDPVDGYQAVMQCDNSDSQHTPMACRYTKVHHSVEISGFFYHSDFMWNQFCEF